MASAAKREGRETSEGLVGYRISDGHATMVAIGCETEPVSKNSEFQEFAKKVLDAVDENGVSAVEGLDDERQELIGKLGENIAVAAPARFEAVDGGVLEGYVHPPANKLGVLVQLRGGNKDLAREARDAHRCVEPAVDLARRRSRATPRPPSGRSTRTRTRCSRSPSRRARRSSRGC